MKTLMKPAHLALASLALASSAVLAPAAFAYNEPTDAFKAMDTDGDAVVTQSEYVAHASANEGMDPEGAKLRFEVLAGQDGELTEAEFTGAMTVLDPADGLATPDAETLPPPGETR